MNEKKEQAVSQAYKAFWSYKKDDILQALNTSEEGLSAEEAEKRIGEQGSLRLNKGHKHPQLVLFLRQFKSPITLILLFAASLSFFLKEHTDAIIIIVIIFFGTILGFIQENSAGKAVEKLLQLIRVQATVKREEKTFDIPIELVVPGDILFLRAGDMIPCDSYILHSTQLFVDEASFTGETFPVEKQAGVLNADTPLAKRSNALFMGSHVVSGSAVVLAVAIGVNTEFGSISQSLKKRVTESDFEKGIRHFGYLLMQFSLIMVILIFAGNLLLHRAVLDSLLFTLAIAVGLTPQLLPAIITINLSMGAKKMAQKQVIVKRLNAIENFGSMNIFCSDKTGTLTEGKVFVKQGLDFEGKPNAAVLLKAKINACLQQGFKNPIDEAIASTPVELNPNYKGLDEIPYDFSRRRLSVLISLDEKTELITKGAVKQVLEICTQIVDAKGDIVPLAPFSKSIIQTYERLSAEGYRTLGVAFKSMGEEKQISKEEEKDMVFAGFIALHDPLKTGITETLRKLGKMGIDLKIITGDNILIATKMAESVGFDTQRILTGEQIENMSGSALAMQVMNTCVFAEVDPRQKEQIILALKKTKNIVGYMGDGINDVSAIHAADVGISVNSAMDVAKGAADIVLLNQDLNLLIEGIIEGRKTFANTQKYILMASSSNFGNMFSMAGASFFLPFLPLLPKQILLTNALTDIPSMTISTDHVDEEWIYKPRKWDIKSIKRFMLLFGILSSLFDFLTFGILLKVMHASEIEFQTAWFIESVVSATLIVLIVRTRKSFVKSKPGKHLLRATLVIAVVALLFPISPFGGMLGFTPLPVKVYFAMLFVVALYLISAELLKRAFFYWRKSA